ncbi:hypothetical protein GCM10023195_79020 [Actinoallomurus liliacearum]|uniref:Uncharacterized protein n=1 Tax=Actinoallomurus liliacearum TaxID=1080073 RepID=A0ABP8U0R4_9ACTN
MLKTAIAAGGLVATTMAASLIGAAPAFAQDDPATGVYYPGTAYIPTTYIPIKSPVLVPERVPSLQEKLRSQEIQTALEHQITLEQMKSQERQTALEHEKTIEQMKSQERQTALDREKLAEQLRLQEIQTSLENKKLVEQSKSSGQQTTSHQSAVERQSTVGQGSEEAAE